MTVEKLAVGLLDPVLSCPCCLRGVRNPNVSGPGACWYRGVVTFVGLAVLAGGVTILIAVMWPVR